MGWYEMSKVYLAGGFRSGWMNAVISNHELINPSKKEKDGNWNINRICTWDKYAIQKADIVFAYLEEDNPSGIGLSCEIGYARALNKVVILVNGKDEEKFLFLNGFADIVFNNYTDGLDFLNRLP
jgi:nucleoside 2-deoxyribosyltransferase